MKKLIAVVIVMLVAVAVAGSADAKTKKKHSNEVQGGGYHGGEYHLRKQGDAKKPLLHWDGYNGPIKGMKESAHKPPAKYPSQSTDK